jgi:hypothetical protein
MSSGLEIREYGRRDPPRLSRVILYPEKLALTSPTRGGLSVGIVHSQTQTSGFIDVVILFLIINILILSSIISVINSIFLEIISVGKDFFSSNN